MFCFHTGKEDFIGLCIITRLSLLQGKYLPVGGGGGGVPDGRPDNTIRAVSMRLEEGTVIRNGGNKIVVSISQGAITPHLVIDFVLLIVEQAVGVRTYSNLNKGIIVNTQKIKKDGFSRDQDKNVKVVAHGAYRKPGHDAIT